MTTDNDSLARAWLERNVAPDGTSNSEQSSVLVQTEAEKAPVPEKPHPVTPEEVPVKASKKPFTARNKKRKPNTPQASDMLTLWEVADDLRLNYEVVARMARAHKIPALRIGRIYRIPRKAFEQWKQERLES